MTATAGRVAAAVTASAAVFAASACGGSSHSAKQDLCDSLKGLATSVSDLRQLTPGSSSRDDYRAAGQKIEDSLDQVDADAKKVKDASTDQLRQATDELTDRVRTIPSDSPLTQVVGDLRSAFTDFTRSFADVVSAEDCNG